MKKLLALSLVALAACSCAGKGEVDKPILASPTSDRVQNLTAPTSSRLASLALKDVAPALSSMNNGVVSPASYLLAVAGLQAVSSNMDFSASLGLQEGDLKELMEAWNYSYEVDGNGMSSDERSEMKALVLHQQVGETYKFDAEKRKAVADDYVSTMKSSLSGYHQDAKNFFHDAGFQLEPPDPQLTVDGVLTYGALKMKDCVEQLHSENKPFLDKSVNAYCFGSDYDPQSVSYAKGPDFCAFTLPVRFTSLLVVLPDEGVALNDIDLGEAFDYFRANHTDEFAMGYLPYFHVASDNVDLTRSLASKLTGDEIPFDRLLEKGVVNNLGLDRVLQSSDFEFNRHGVSGESITVIAYSGSAGPKEHEIKRIEVNRPFYCLSMKNGFPLFANKVTAL